MNVFLRTRNSDLRFPPSDCWGTGSSVLLRPGVEEFPSYVPKKYTASVFRDMSQFTDSQPSIWRLYVPS